MSSATSDDAGETSADKSDSEHEEADDCKLHVLGVQTDHSGGSSGGFPGGLSGSFSGGSSSDLSGELSGGFLGGLSGRLSGGFFGGSRSDLCGGLFIMSRMASVSAVSLALTDNLPSTDRQQTTSENYKSDLRGTQPMHRQ